MSDPFLLAHQPVAGLHIYNLGGRLVPISIRDQMIRAQLLVSRLHEHHHEDVRVIGVVGAGACGATAALAAVHKGIRAYLIDSGARPFDLQLRASTRWIDPTQYDWPVDHWDQGRFPWLSGTAMPLPWASGPADAVARRWQLRLYQQWMQHGSVLSTRLLKMRMRTRAGVPRWSPSGRMLLPLTYLPHGSTANLPVDAIILAGGFGAERCSPTQGSFDRGFHFWETDPYGAPDLGLAPVAPDVLISGGGDGALQDLLRVLTTTKSAAQLFSTVAGNLSAQGRVELELAMSSASIRTKSAMHWGTGARHDHDLHAEIEAVCFGEATRLLQDPGVSQAIDGLLRPTLPAVRLVHTCNHFDCYYDLNRFLAALLLEHLRKRGAKVERVGEGRTFTNSRTADAPS